MPPDRLQQKAMVDTVKEALDIKVQDPVVPPTPLTGDSHGLTSRLPWSIPIRIRMEMVLQNRLQVPLDYRLGDAVRDRRDGSR